MLLLGFLTIAKPLYDLQRIEPSRYYTSRFSGTSSASPIVVGTICALQGIAKKMNRPLTPKMARDILRNHKGSPQTGNTREKIGTRPDLAEMINEYQKYL